MNIDIQSLGTFNRLAHEGGQRAAVSLSAMTGIETHVHVTKIALVPRDEVADAAHTDAFAGVQIGFEGALSGRTALVFDRESARTLVSTLVPDSAEEIDGMSESGVKEIGNITVSGFIDGWANYLETTIDITPPTYVEGTSEEIIPDMPGIGEEDHVLMFKSRIEAVDEEVSFYVCMLLEGDSIESLLAAREPGANTISIEKLAAFNRMTNQGAKQASQYMTSMTGIETSVEVSQLGFVPIENAAAQVDEGNHVGVVFEFDGPPSGYVAILFDEASAEEVADAMVPGSGGSSDGGNGGDGTDANGAGVEFEGMRKSAIQEIGNIMTSGFVDGWANVLGTTIDTSPPQFVHDSGRAIVSPVAARLGRTQEFAFVIDSTIRTADRELGCDIYALPDNDELKRALDDVDADVERAETAGQH